MKLRCAFALCAFAYCALVVAADQESKYNEIIKLLSDSDANLKPAAQTYSSSVVDPSGYSRSSERSRYSSSKDSAKASNDEDDEKKLEDEEDKKPDRLAILLADSKFTCDGLKSGYYADESVGCQVFHYCVDGVKHSWQCPENTVFHQIHLNCVPNTQDICRDSAKFHVVNDYLHKELNERGPNNTVLYSQRFYPEGFDFSGGDTVTQIFQAQAQAALQRARERENRNNNNNNDDSSDYEDEPKPRVQSRPKPSYTPSTQSVRPQAVNRPVYKQPASRPVAIPATYAPQPVPTKRPVSYTTPEAYSPPSYSEDNDSDDYSSSSGSASSSGASPSFSSPSLGSSSSYSSGGASLASSYSPSNPSSSSFSSSSNSQPSTSFRPSSSSRPNYHSRQLGIPIASFRVAPSSVGASASHRQEVAVPLINVPNAAFNNQGYYF